MPFCLPTDANVACRRVAEGVRGKTRRPSPPVAGQQTRVGHALLHVTQTSGGPKLWNLCRCAARPHSKSAPGNAYNGNTSNC